MLFKLLFSRCYANLLGTKIARASLHPIDLGAWGADFEGGVCYFDDQLEFESKIIEVACAINPCIDIWYWGESHWRTLKMDSNNCNLPNLPPFSDKLF